MWFGWGGLFEHRQLNFVTGTLLQAAFMIYFSFPFIAAFSSLILLTTYFGSVRRHGGWVFVAVVGTIGVWLYILSLNHWMISHPTRQRVFW